MSSLNVMSYSTLDVEEYRDLETRPSYVWYFNKGASFCFCSCQGFLFQSEAGTKPVSAGDICCLQLPRDHITLSYCCL